MQKVFSYLLLLIISMSSPAALFASSLQVPLPPAFKEPGSCKNQIPIASKDVNKAGGFVIQAPGCYMLKGNIIFDPSVSQSTSAITIQSSNVTLNLGGHKLSQLMPQSGGPISGVTANSISSISIMNGSIGDFTGAAIGIQNSNNIVVANLTILNTGLPMANGGLQINDSANILVSQVNAISNFGSGMYLHGVTNATVSNSHFDNNLPGNVAPQFFTTGQVGAGAYIDSSPSTETDTVLVRDSTFNGNSGDSDGGGMEIGIYSLLPVKNVTVVRSTFLNNFNNGIQGLFNDASGLVLLFVTNFLIQDVVASGQRHPGPPGPLLAVAGATGFSINACNNGLIVNGSADNNVGAGYSSLGMRLRGCNNVLVKNSHASGNINTSFGQAFGFSTDNDNYIAFPPVGTSVVFDACVAQNNNSTSGLAGGFKITNVANSTLQYSVSQNNPIGIYVSDANAPTLSFNNVFNGNLVSKNTLYGIQDTVGGSNNAYSDNIAILNGTSPALDNYVGLPAGTPIITWSFTTGFSPTPPNFDPLANLSIVP